MSLPNHMYTYHNLNGPYFSYIIRCPFASPRVTYDGWRSEFTFIKPLWAIFYVFSFEKHTFATTDSQTGIIK